MSTEIVLPVMNADEARACVSAINGHMEDARRLLLDLYEREGWRALGYASWRECVVAEFSQSERYLYRQLEAAQLEREIWPIGQTPPPLTEWHLRQIAQLPAEDRREVAVALADTNLTTEDARRLIAAKQTPATPKPPPEPGTPPEIPLLRFAQADLPTATIVSLILRVAFPDAETALDVTYGSGNFWDGTAHVRVTAHDADPARAPHGSLDFRSLPYDDASFDVVLFDPPHIADAGDDSIMGERFGTLGESDLKSSVECGTLEAWRVARLGMVVKVTDHVHGQRFVCESDWVRLALTGAAPYDVVHQTRSGALVDPKWEEQLSAHNNGSTYLIFRRGDQRHMRRGQHAEAAST